MLVIPAKQVPARPVSSSRCRSRRDGTTSPPRSWPRRWKQAPLICRWSRSPTSLPSRAVRFGRRRRARNGGSRLMTALRIIGYEPPARRRCRPARCPFRHVTKPDLDHLPMNLAFVAGVLAGTKSRSLTRFCRRRRGAPASFSLHSLERRHSHSATSSPCSRRSLLDQLSGESCIDNANEYCRYWQPGNSRAPYRHVEMPPDHADGAAATAQQSPLTSGTHTRHGSGGRDGRTNGSTDMAKGAGASRVWRRWDCFRRVPTQVERADDSCGTESVRPVGRLSRDRRGRRPLR